MKERAAEARLAGAYLAELARFLRRPLSAAQSRTLIEDAQQRRAERFLALLEGAVFAKPGVAPYRALLDHAGFDLSRIAAAVRRDGLEAALERLHDAGVFLFLDEFKGRRPIERDGLELECRPEDFDNPLVNGHFVAHTGGSTEAPRRIQIDLEEVAHEAAHLELLLEGLDARDRRHAAWLPPPPSVAGVKWALRHAKRGRPPERWFAHRPLTLRGDEAGFALFTAATAAAAWALGHRLPWPTHTPPDQAVRIAAWLRRARDAGTPAVLRTYPSSAVRVCQAAEAAGIDISGTVFSLVGEPLTGAKHHQITHSGCQAVCTYYITEAGQLGNACTDRRPIDDVHVLTDRAALSTREHEVVPGRSVSAIYVTTLAPSAPKVMLNVESGDEGTLEEADCGCPTGKLGLRVHLHAIRSYEKLVSEGMNFLGQELAQVLEDVLPARFGGVATDYQLLEREQDGLSRVLLLVHPRIGPLDEQGIVDAMITHLAAAGRSQAMMADMWRSSGTLTVVRAEPESTASWKTHSVQIERGR